MRQPQQKNRGRGRGRKPQNSLSRNFESNGPDVKIRGNAGHIAEKYTTLARDALSNGDTVMAENYFQHAEHYNRIVAAAQQQSKERAEEAAAQAQANGKGPQPDGEAGSQNQNDAPKSDANGSAEGDAEVASETSSRPQRGSRRRKPAESASEQSNESADDSNKEETPIEVAAAQVEGVSDDAAKLPGSIIGELVSEETS